MLQTHIDSSSNVATCRVFGFTQFVQTARALQNILERTEGAGVTRVLFVVQGTNAELACTEMRSLLPLMLRWTQQHLGRRWALVLPTVAEVELCGRIRDELNVSSNWFGCFSEELAAREWLNAVSPNAAIRDVERHA